MQYKDSLFQGGRVLLDGSEFYSCRFEGTIMVVTGTAPATLKDCAFINVRWEFDGPASLTLNFLAAMYQGAGEGGKQLVEQVFDTIRGKAHQTLSPAAAEARATAGSSSL